MRIPIARRRQRPGVRDRALQHRDLLVVELGVAQQLVHRAATARCQRLPGEGHEHRALPLAQVVAGGLARDGGIAEELERRQRSDFLAPVNHAKEVAVFYSTRHGHGTEIGRLLPTARSLRIISANAAK